MGTESVENVPFKIGGVSRQVGEHLLWPSSVTNYESSMHMDSMHNRNIRHIQTNDQTTDSLIATDT